MKFIKSAKFKFLFSIFIAVSAVFVFVFNAEAGKVSDIIKRVRTKSSVFLPLSRQTEITAIRNSVFYSPVETNIVQGPPQGGVFQNTRVEFLLDGWQIVPFKKTTRFDVWLVGFDVNWKETSNSVFYDLPVEHKTYTLLARAKNEKGEYDSTAAARIFTVNVSPYFGKIKISGVSWRGFSNKPEYEKLAVINQNSGEAVNVSGWRLAAKRSGFSFFIPAATTIYNPRSLDQNNPVILKKGGEAQIYVGKTSPLGVNFQENSCTSFLRNSFEGYDSLSSSASCPAVSSSSYSGFSIECRSYIKSLNSCSMPQLEYYRFINEPSCRDFILRNYTYQSCLERSRYQTDFYSGKWKIYLGRNHEILDDLDDVIYLYDFRGLLVDTYSY